MRFHLVLSSLFISILLVQCSSYDQEKPATNSGTAHLAETIALNSESLDLKQIITDPCDTFSYEISGLYPVLETMPEANSEKLVIDDHLKSMGFELKSSGWGNWEKGPRIVVLELKKDSCFCRIYKKYYYKDTLANGKFNLRINEKIVCNAENNAFE